MQTKSFKKSAPKFAKLQGLAIVIQTGTQLEIIQATHALKNAADFSTIGWQENFSKLIQLTIDGRPKFSIFKKGNSKLPFYAFSTLPGVTCPGAGACIDFCYSYRAWRYPASFMRQVQNAYLLRFHKPVIAAAMSTLPGAYDMRLYVDGDFSSADDVDFWMMQLKNYPQANAYGYSKSFSALLEYDQKNAWPENYTLNISSGHNSGAAIVQKIEALPITRGHFVAVAVGFKPEHGTKKTNDAIRAKFDTKIFPCPGKCGTCTSAGHACGMPKMSGRIIAIAIH